MRKLLALLFLSVSVCYATEQPPYETKDTAINENFRTIYYTVDKHKHNNDDSSRLDTIIPSSGSTYNLGSATTKWGTVWADTVTASRVSGDGSGLFNLSTGGSSPSVSVSTTNSIYNLTITTNGNDTNQWVITVGAADIMGKQYVNISTTLAMNVVGAGGCDVAEGSSKWYRIYLISNDAGTQAGVIASESRTAPTLTGVSWATKWRAIGNVYNDASSNLIPFVKNGSYVRLWKHREIYFSADFSNTTVSLATFIPIDAVSIEVNSALNAKLKDTLEQSYMKGDGCTGETGSGSNYSLYVSFISPIDNGQFTVKNYFPLCGQNRNLYLTESSGDIGQALLTILSYVEEIQ